MDMDKPLAYLVDRANDFAQRAEVCRENAKIEQAKADVFASCAIELRVAIQREQQRSGKGEIPVQP